MLKPLMLPFIHKYKKLIQNHINIKGTSGDSFNKIN